MEVRYTEAGAPKQLKCKLLVGADGYFSAVRQQCLQDGPPDFAVSVLFAFTRHDELLHRTSRQRLGYVVKGTFQWSAWHGGADENMLQCAAI